ncbi:hypothetical protein TH63_01800 [Rufibacter radiotolerans]|uniref:DUF418 domain-containing protein n=1 Tax=Rufibacter radiotolerans TaxID=1379910 RepID=A0A0H4W2I4_9BACT|nr:DUF418 domain-containing protein [Rufibacter radiotolerans]AKQ44646.1 hypothetical protein TH63_01800 [Rufibacter radiotolerans]
MELVQSANLKDSLPGRIDQLDVLRGFALLGIGLENIFSMHTPNAFFSDYAANYGQGLNHFLLLGLMVIVRGKFYPIFSFLFGASAALGLPSQGAGFFLRRLGGLFLLGALQIVFIWEGDVLVQYVFMGCLLLPLRNWSPRALAAAGAFLLLFSFAGRICEPPLGVTAPENLAIYETGTFWELASFRLQEYQKHIFTWTALLFYSRIFAFMLLGFAFAKGKSIQWLASPAQVRKVFMGHLAIVAVVALLVQVAGWRGGAGHMPWLKEVSVGIYFYAAVVCLAALPGLLWQLPGFRACLEPLKYLGKLTLTHYLFQNLLFSLLFYRYGLGLFGDLAPWQISLLYLAVISLQLAVSKWLLRKWKQGPAEHLVRWVAGKKKKAPLG